MIAWIVRIFHPRARPRTVNHCALMTEHGTEILTTMRQLDRDYPAAPMLDEVAQRYDSFTYSDRGDVVHYNPNPLFREALKRAQLKYPGNEWGA